MLEIRNITQVTKILTVVYSLPPSKVVVATSAERPWEDGACWDK